MSNNNQDIFKKVRDIIECNNKECTEKQLYEKVADFYLKTVCSDENNNPVEKCDKKQKLEKKKQISEIIKYLESKSMDKFIQGKVSQEKEKQKQKIKKAYLEESRKITIEILRKYNSTNFIDLDDIIFRFFPNTNTDFTYEGSNRDKIEKQIHYTIKGYRSEMEPSTDSKVFQRVIPSLHVVYPHGFVDEFMSQILDVENLLEMNGRQGDRTRDKNIDNAVIKKKHNTSAKLEYPYKNKK
jgi:hypothetical protein